MSVEHSTRFGVMALTAWVWFLMAQTVAFGQAVCVDFDKDGVCDGAYSFSVSLDPAPAEFPLDLIYQFAASNSGETDLADVAICDLELIGDALAAGLTIGACDLCDGVCDGTDDTCADLGVVVPGGRTTAACTLTVPDAAAWIRFAALDDVEDSCYDNSADVFGAAVVGAGTCGNRQVESSCEAVICLEIASCEISVTKEACIIPSPPGGEGCTPGYWKNHPSSWPDGYETGDDFDATFGVDAFDPNVTLMQAANLGGGEVNALARHAVAALLNAASGGVEYSMSVAEVIARVQAALAPGGDVEGTKDRLESFNEDGCPLGEEDEGAKASRTVATEPECLPQIPCGSTTTEVLYTYAITNHSPAAVTNVTVVDIPLGVVPGSPIATIGVGETATLTWTVVVPGEMTNTVIVMANLGPAVCEATATATVTDDCDGECEDDEDCDDGNICTDDRCADGLCEYDDNTSACDDGDACTVDDVCAAGRCSGTPLECPPGQYCDPADGICKDLGGEGCTPGFWKNHFEVWPDGYTPDDDFDAVFGVDAFSPDVELGRALKLHGGGVSALARHATAALLNAASTDVDFASSVDEVIGMVQAALAPGGDIEGAKDQLESFNEQGCPLGSGEDRLRTR